MEQQEAIRVTLAAARRRGYVISRREALRLGVHDRQLQAMTESGILLRPHPGVYLEGSRRHDPYASVGAASIYVGSGGVVSHQTAAWLLGLVDRLEPVIHATVVSRPRYRGIRFHVADTLPPTLSCRGIRCTVPPRTIVDIAPDLTVEEIDAVVDRALISGVTRVGDLRLEASGHRRGSAVLRRSLEGLGHIGAPDASQLEAEMRRLIQRYGLPAPAVQVRAGPDGCFRVDSAWRDRRLIAELYGYAWHHSPRQLKHDAARQRQLTIDGWQVLVFTWLDVKHDPDRVADDLRRALSGPGAH